MPDPTPPAGGSVTTTTIAGVGTSTMLLALQYATHPVWPPPDSLLTVLAGYLAPVAHLIGRAIYRKIADAAGEPLQGAVTPPPAPAQGPAP